MEGEPVFSPKAAMRISAVVGALTAALVSASAALAIPAFPLTLTIIGSTTVYPTAHAVLAGPFTAAFTDTNVATGDVQQPGSGVGIGNILCGLADVATASRPLQAGDDTSTTVCATPHAFQTGQIDQWVVGKDGITIITNQPSLVAVTNLSVADLRSIYSCGLAAGSTAIPTRTWHDLNAAFPSTQIIGFSRETTSGTYGDFLGFIGVTPAQEQACVAQGATATARRISGTGNPVMVTSTQGNANSIAYVGFGFAATATGTAISAVNGIVPNATTVDNASYPFARQLFMDTIKGSALPATGTRTDNWARAVDFVNTTISSAGQNALLGEGEFSLNTTPAENPITSLGCTTDGATGQLVCPQAIPDWDVNLDNLDDINDIVGVGQLWLQSAGGGHGHWDRRDVTRDGTDDINDVVAVGQHWLQGWTRWSR
jgi:ABC-type phosphate transport system substrate-binding protein